MVKHVLQAVQVNKTFTDPIPQRVLSDVSFSINRGEFVSITGKSGCGKSTLLYILSTMDTDYSGEVYIDGESMSDKPKSYHAHIRNEKIGFVFQFHYLLNEFSVLENVMLPALKLGRHTNREIERSARERLRELDIAPLATKKPRNLSGGEKQRVAIARALINSPAVILCDEPTGNLDKANSNRVFDIFSRLVKDNGQTIVVVTHDAEFSQRTQRTIRMDDGRIVADAN